MIDGDHPLANWITVTVDGKPTYATEIHKNFVVAPTWYGFSSEQVKAVELTETVYQIFGKVRILVDPNCPIDPRAYPEIVSLAV